MKIVELINGNSATIEADSNDSLVIAVSNQYNGDVTKFQLDFDSSLIDGEYVSAICLSSGEADAKIVEDPDPVCVQLRKSGRYLWFVSQPEYIVDTQRCPCGCDAVECGG